jgi:hypothetical protein
VLEDYRATAEHLRACADYLEATRADDPLLAERLAAGARHYRHTAEAWTLRAALYGTYDRLSRLRLLRRLLLAGAYGSRTIGGLGRAALAKDVAAGVALRARD